MDYGKLAYLRLEEVEAALSPKRQARLKNTSLSVYPDFPLIAANDYHFAALEGTGTLTAVLCISAEVRTAGRISVYIGGIKAGFIDFSDAGVFERVLCVSVRVADNGQILLRAENGFYGFLTGISAALIGENASLMRMRDDFAADESNGDCGVLRGINGDLQLQVFRAGEVIRHTSMGRGASADICADGAGGFFAAYSDFSDNCWITHYSAQGGERRTRIGSGAESAAVMNTGEGLLAALVRGGGVFLYELDYNLDIFGAEERLQHEGTVSRAAFVKNTEHPILLISDGRKIFARFGTEESVRNSDTFIGNITAFLEDL
ncbi:MAG: hypothetical protein FWH03_01215 [Firmicutes bacterium]|nr:hypothetical protein [Bacillota bacterium]